MVKKFCKRTQMTNFVLIFFIDFLLSSHQTTSVI